MCALLGRESDEKEPSPPPSFFRFCDPCACCKAPALRASPLLRIPRNTLWDAAVALSKVRSGMAHPSTHSSTFAFMFAPQK